jgi:glycosyltransferase involved in cell wall biosynthesis
VAGDVLLAVDGQSLDSPDELVAALRELIENREWREFLGRGALDKSRTFTWANAQKDFGAILETFGR